MNDRHTLQHMLDLACAMWDDPRVYHYQNLELTPESERSIFLAGPTSREGVLEYKWRIFAVHHLRSLGYTGIIYVPEARENDWSFRETFPIPIVQWERERILASATTLVWLPRHPVQLPGRLTNFELGFLSGAAYAAPDTWKNKVVFGCPNDAWKTRSELHWLTFAGINQHPTLKCVCREASERVR